MSTRTKNKIILIIICILTLAILFAALRFNENRISSINNKSYIGNYLTEIKYSSINDFIVENRNVVIYVSNSNDTKSKDFEKYFSKVIKKYNLESNIYYININDTNIVDLFYQNAPEFIIYKDAEVSEVIDATTLKDYNMIVSSLKERGIINE